jgi:excinuclease ABC subunit A
LAQVCSAPSFVNDEIVAAGTPEDVVKVKRSYTGQLLAPVLGRKAAGPKKKGQKAAE